MNRRIVIVALLLIVTGIILGAFGAHALKEMLEPEKLASFETGVRYQIYHGLGLLVLGVNEKGFRINLGWVYRLLFLGVILFSGSIYLLAVQEQMGVSLSFLWPVTPTGGLLMISGWSLMIIRLFNDRQMSE